MHASPWPRDMAGTRILVAGMSRDSGSVLADRRPAVGELVPKSDVLVYQSKNQESGAEEVAATDPSEEQARGIPERAVRAHRARKREGFSRVDFRPDQDRKGRRQWKEGRGNIRGTR